MLRSQDLNKLTEQEFEKLFNEYQAKYDEILHICEEYHRKRILPEANKDILKAESLLRQLEDEGRQGKYLARYFVFKYSFDCIERSTANPFVKIKIKANLNQWRAEFSSHLRSGQLDRMSYLSVLSLGLKIHSSSSAPTYKDIASGYFLTATLLDFDANNTLVKEIRKNIDFLRSRLKHEDDLTSTWKRLNKYYPVIFKNNHNQDISDFHLEEFFNKYIKSELLRSKILNKLREIMSPEKVATPATTKEVTPGGTPSTSGLFAQQSAKEVSTTELEAEIKQLRLTLATKETQLAEINGESTRNTLNG